MWNVNCWINVELKIWNLIYVLSGDGEKREDNYVLIEDQIYKLVHELIQVVHDNLILVVIDETSSGKTTQVTLYLEEERSVDHNHEWW